MSQVEKTQSSKSRRRRNKKSAPIGAAAVYTKGDGIHTPLEIFPTNSNCPKAFFRQRPKIPDSETEAIAQGCTHYHREISFGFLCYRYDTNGKIQFIIQRGSNSKKYGLIKGRYELEDNDESGYTTAKREFAEETGLDWNRSVLFADFTVFYQNRHVKTQPKQSQIKQKRNVLFILQCRSPPHSPDKLVTAVPDEIDLLEWVDYPTLIRLVSTHPTIKYRAMVEYLIKKGNIAMQMQMPSNYNDSTIIYQRYSHLLTPNNQSNHTNNSKRMKHLMHNLAWILRKGAVELHLPINRDLFIPITAILNTPQFKSNHATPHDIKHIVDKDVVSREHGFIMSGDMISIATHHSGQLLYYAQRSKALISQPQPSIYSTVANGAVSNGGRMASFGEQSRDRDTIAVSKSLTWLLRHGAESYRLPMDKAGYIRIDYVMKCPTLRQFKLSFQDLQRIVTTDGKNRFNSERRNDGRWYIRANQGHSTTIVESQSLAKEILLQHCNAAHLAKGVIHGTNYDPYRMIQKCGLSKMSRKHIHFTTQQFLRSNESNAPKSGFRQSSELLIYVDIAQCIRDGIRFYQSSNDVILSEGDRSGVILPKYFIKVVEFKFGKEGKIVYQSSSNHSNTGSDISKIAEKK